MKFAATDFDISIAGTDFSDSIAALTLDISREQLEITAFGDAARRYIGGLQDSSVTLSFHQDFASGSVDSTVWGNLGGTVAIVVKPTSGAVSATNPSYSFRFSRSPSPSPRPSSSPNPSFPFVLR